MHHNEVALSIKALNLIQGKVKKEFLEKRESEFNSSQSEKKLSPCVRNITPSPCIDHELVNDNMNSF